MTLLSVRVIELELEVGEFAARIARELRRRGKVRGNGEGSGGWVSPHRLQLDGSGE